MHHFAGKKKSLPAYRSIILKYHAHFYDARSIAALAMAYFVQFHEKGFVFPNPCPGGSPP
jgi:hypothetical protein